MSVKTYGIETTDFEQASRKEIYAYFKQKEFVQFDSETSGFSCHHDKLVCIQLGDYDNQFVIHPDKILEFKTLLQRRILVLHNAKFDLKFLYKNDIWPTAVYDTFLAEGVIYCGIKTHKKALNIVAKNRLGIDLDKSIRDNIGKEGLTKRVIEYSADDVKYLELIKDSQKIELDKWNLHKALEIENQYVLALAYIEYCGIGFDKKAWEVKCLKDEQELIKAEKECNKYIFDNGLIKFINPQLDLFSSEKSTNISWSSPKQVVEFFKFLGINTKIVEKGEEKDSVEAKHIEKYSKEYPFIDKYLLYKEKDKVVSTYGRSWLEQISPITGRIHTSYQQIMDTGRTSCGNKRENTKNLQNIPTDEDTRGCFVAEKGNAFIVADFTAQEDMIFVEYSQEQKMIEFYNDTSRKRDGHSFVAKMCFPKELDGIEEENVKEERGDLRDNAKKGKFAIHYGGNGSTIAANINIPIEEGNAIYDGYMEGFPDIAAYFKKVKAESLKNGYILISPRTGRKSFIWGYDKYKQLNRELTRDFWNKWKVEKQRMLEGRETAAYSEMKQKIKDYFNIKGEIEKKALNYPIQGTAGETTKIATISFFEWIRKENLFNIVKIVNTVHDEIDAESPKKLAKIVASKLEEVMADAGDLYCHVVKLKAVASISTKWKK